MTREEIAKRFKQLQETELQKGAPWYYSERIARQTLIKELTDSGMKNHEAVFEIYKAQQEANNAM